MKEVFSFRPQAEPVGQVAHSVLRVQFGDGYAQMAADGLHAKRQSWPLVFVERKDKMAQIRNFLDRHAGFKTFLWTPPFSEQGIYCARDGYKLTPLAGGQYAKLEVTFQEEVQP